MIIWGSGKPLREFMHVDDLADACVFLMKEYNGKQFLNAGSGEEISIGDLALLIASIVGYKGKIELDSNKPDGSPRKLMDSSKLNALGWTSKITLEQGIRSVYTDMKKIWEV